MLSTERHFKKIAFVGAEPTGKITLASRLAGYYGTVWVHEYGRDYLQAKNASCTWDDVLAVVQGQTDALNGKALPHGIVSKQERGRRAYERWR